MKSNLNLDYFIYKVFFMTSAYVQEIGEKTFRLFIINNDTLNIFPEFIRYILSEDAGNVYLGSVIINIKRIDDIIYEVRQLAYSKCNEIES